MDKLYINVQVRLIVNKDSDIDATEVMENMDYNFRDQTGKADVVDTEIKDWEITDAK